MMGKRKYTPIITGPPPEPETVIPAPRVVCLICKAKTLEANIEDGYLLDLYDERGNPRRNWSICKFNPDVPAHGAMFHLAPDLDYKGYPYVPSQAYSRNLLVCPACRGPLCNSQGRVALDGPMPPPRIYLGAGVLHVPAVQWEECRES
jgi:hypothetical protein